MKKEHPQMKHQFDVWHFAKNIKKTNKIKKLL